MQEVNCKICNKEFKTKKARLKIGRGKYCSRVCFSVACKSRVGYWKGKVRSTPWMLGENNPSIKNGVWNKGKKIPQTTGENNVRWISDRTKLKTDRRQAYDMRYKEWLKEVRNRDGWKCKIGNNDCSGRLETHHILSWRDHPELRYNINNGITLCHFHHPREFSKEKEMQSVFLEINGTDWKTLWAVAQ